MKQFLILFCITIFSHMTIHAQQRIDNIIDDLSTTESSITFTSTIKRNPKTRSILSIQKDLEFSNSHLVSQLKNAFKAEAKNAAHTKLTNENGEQHHLLHFNQKGKKSLYLLITNEERHQGKVTIIVKYTK